jgi:two-component system LytT family response regulator
VTASIKKRWRALIVDDEELARHIIRELLQPHSEIEVAAECSNGFEAVKAYSEHKPDLIFLDVQMPKLTGFDVLELIGEDISVIFVTAYDQYAMRAFEVHAVDYLLKPIGKKRFEEALERAKSRLGEKMPSAQKLADSARPPQQFLERIVVKDGTRVTLIPVAKLDYVEAQDDYVGLTSQGKKHLKQQTIASLEACLDPNFFVRIHRSYIVNLERVARIEPYGKDSRLAILNDGARLPVSRTGYARLQSLLDERK